MDHSDLDTWARFGRLLTGDASESDELAHWERLGTDPSYAASWRAAQATWDGMVPAPKQWDVGAAQARLQARLRPPAVRHAEPPRRWRVGTALAAAAVVAVVTVGVRLSTGRAPTPGSGATAAGRSVTGADRAVPLRAASRDTTQRDDRDSITTAAGRTRRVTLTDGSIVTLLPGSTLTLPRSAGTSWGAVTRELTLTGEASFAVQRDTLRPFVVRSGHAEVRVLGTEFVVSSYIARHGLRGRDVIGVAVREGRVALRHVGPHDADTAPMRILRSGDAAAMAPNGRLSSIRAADLLDLHDGRLVFAQAPLADVMREITRWYAVDVAFEPDVARGLLVTTTIERGTIDDVIDQLGFTIGLRITREGRTIRLAPQTP